jgi:hypothetical protein
MNRLVSNIADLYAFNGRTIFDPLPVALKELEISKESLEKRNQRIKSVMNGVKPDVIPMYADTKWWFVEKYHDGTLQKELEGCDVDKILSSSRISFPLKSFEELEPIPGIKEEEFWSGEPVKYVNGGYPGRQRTVRITTPVGTLTASESYASRSFGIKEYPVKSIEDLEVVRYIYEQIVKNSSKAVTGVGAPLTPIQTLITRLAGVEPAIYMLYDEKEEVEAFMDFLESIQLPVIELIAEKNDMVFSVENLSSDVSGSFFDDYLGPQLKKRSEIIKKYNAVHGIHHDGKLQPLFSRLQEVGVNYVNGVTAAPSGDVEAEELRTLGGEEIVIHDILPQSIFTSEYSEKDFIEYIKRVFEFYKNDGRIIFGIGDMLPSNGSIKRFEYAINLLEEITG